MTTAACRFFRTMAMLRVSARLGLGSYRLGSREVANVFASSF